MPAAKPKLDPVGMLEKEFDYIAETAFQANEDRARVLSFYMVTVASLLGAILGVQFAESAGLYYSFSALFLLLSIFGLLTLLQLIRLRQAWGGSAKAMNTIKEYYIQQHPDLAKAITWRMSTLPKGDKPWSIGFLQALQVSLLGGVTLGAAAYCLSAALGSASWLIAVVTGLAVIVIQMWVYRRILHD